ncbi:P [Cereal chlorotic mottle virus]|uniref:P n=1 Tax=Cereal chlorotic mottle virus TaxID=2964312 RepID=A0A976RX39_9RHAB|nr:P [Cereal chlorotic mottle virus] [Cereal chlorotic mottle virus]
MSRPVTRSSTGNTNGERFFTNLNAHRTKYAGPPSEHLEGIQIPHSATDTAKHPPPTAPTEPTPPDCDQEMAPTGDMTERREELKKMITTTLMDKGCVPDEFAMGQILKAHKNNIEDIRKPLEMDMNYLSIFAQGWSLSQRRYADMALENLKKNIDPIVATLAVTSANLKGVSDSISQTARLLKIRSNKVSFKPSSPKEIAKRIDKIRGKMKSTEDMMNPISPLPKEQDKDDLESDEDEEETFPQYSPDVLKDSWNNITDKEKKMLFLGFVKAATGIDNTEDIPKEILDRAKTEIRGQQLVTAYLMKEDEIERDKILSYIKKVWADQGMEDKMDTA